MRRRRRMRATCSVTIINDINHNNKYDDTNTNITAIIKRNTNTTINANNNNNNNSTNNHTNDNSNNNTEDESFKLYVQRAQSKSERAMEFKKHQVVQDRRL